MYERSNDSRTGEYNGNQDSEQSRQAVQTIDSRTGEYNGNQDSEQSRQAVQTISKEESRWFEARLSGHPRMFDLLST